VCGVNPSTASDAAISRFRLPLWNCEKVVTNGSTWAVSG
jgi:hypothetical protein